MQNSSPRAKISVAWLHPVLPNYRVPLLQRLAQRTDMQVTSFYGSGKDGFSARSAESEFSTLDTRWVKSYPWPLPGERILWQAAVRDLLHGSYDVIVCQETIHNLTNWALWATRTLHKKKMIFYGYGYRPNKVAAGLRTLHDRLRRVFLASADAVIVYTDRGRSECVRTGLNAQKVFTCGNTVDTECLMAFAQDRKVKEDAEQLRRQLDLADRPVLVHVGRLVPEKRTDLLLEAFRNLQGTTPQPALLVVGDEGVALPSLVQQAKGLERVHFLGPMYPDRELAKVFLLADLLVIPGRVGLTCIHGFCYGVPVVTTQHGVEQSPELDYVRHEENGYLVDAPRPELYVAAIMRLLNDRKKLGEMREQARQTARALTMTHMASQFASAVQYAVTKERPRSLTNGEERPRTSLHEREAC